MLVVNPSNIDPKLLAQEINTMMPLVRQDLAEVKDMITYGKAQWLKFVKDKEMMQALAFIDCFEWNTGETLNIKELSTINNLSYREITSVLLQQH